jgi:hypothetical protein
VDPNAPSIAANESTILGGTMKYLCLVFVDEKKLAALSSADAQALNNDSLAYDRYLRQNGHFIAAQALEFVKSAATVRRQGGKVSVTDGPFTETNEQVGGFILVDAKDRNEAIQIASQIPVLRYGRVEVRPVKELVETK